MGDVVDTGASAPAPDAGASAPAAAPVEAAPAASSPSTPEFDWNAWDGSDDVVPEAFRPVVSRVRSLAEKTWSEKLSPLEQELQALKAKASDDADFLRIFESTGETPAMREARAELERLKAEQSGWGTKRTEYESQIQDLETQLDAALSFRAEQEARAAIEKYPHIFENEQARRIIGEMIDKGLDLDDAVVIAANRSGLPIGAPAPLSPVAEVTPGANGRPSTGSVPKQPAYAIKDAVNDVVDDVFNVRPFARRA